jgi:hypothetical protein
MGRIFCETRYTKKTLGHKLLQQTTNMFGGPHLFSHSKVVHSTACYLSNDNRLLTLKIQEGAPFCKEDLFLLHFLRTYADVTITTGKILRDEPHAFDDRVTQTLGLPLEVYFDQVRKMPKTKEEKQQKETKQKSVEQIIESDLSLASKEQPLPKPQKPIAIMTNQITEHLLETGSPIYRDVRYRKLLLTERRTYDHLENKHADTVDRLGKHNNVIVPFDGKLTLRTAIKYLQGPNPYSTHGFDQVFIENGASTTIPCYSETYNVNSSKAPPIDWTCDGNPIDTLMLSIFSGTLTEKSNACVGLPFLNYKWLLSQYNLV